MRACILIHVFLMMGLAACGGGAGESASAGAAARPAGRLAGPEEAVRLAAVDRSTPDLALKSYWRFRAVEDSLGRRVVEPLHTEAWKAARRSFFGGTALEEMRREQPVESFSREVLEVDQQTGSLAFVVVRVRNTTPVPPGAVPQEWTQKARAEGERYRFVMERDSAGWKIAQVQDWDQFNNAWRDRFGTGPHIPTWTNAY